MVGPRYVATLLALAGCGLSSTTPTARVFKGLASAEPMSPIAALPLTCDPICEERPGAPRTCQTECPERLTAAIASRTRMDLELAGYDVIDTELLDADVRTHAIEDSAERRVDGRRWAELDAGDKREVLEAMGARGVLVTHIGITEPRGVAGRQVVTVTLEAHRVTDDELAWRASCAVDTGFHRRLDEAVAEGTRCAMESAALW